MRPNVRRTFVVIFLLITIFFIIMAAYTTHLYFEVYVAIRNLNVAVPKLSVQVFNMSYAFAETTLNIQNPSGCTLELLGIMEGLSLDGEFILTESGGAHKKMHPMSNVTITLDAEIPRHKLQYVKGRLEKMWIVDVRIFLRGPLVGLFSYKRSWFVTKI